MVLALEGEAPALAKLLRSEGARVLGLMERVELRLAEVAAGHGAPLATHAGDTIAAGGKRLRPLLVLIAAADAPADAGGAVRAAVAVELIHSATLVHDDVLDGAALRRGHPTVVSAAGRALATATGDLLFSRAFAELAASGHREQVAALSAASTALALGELRQREDAWDPTVSPQRYLERCELKTARLFQAACELGAHQCEGGAIAALGAFGRSIGLAFQVLDDVLDVTGPAERTGKHRGTDLLDGTVTLPLILARQQDSSLATTDLRALSGPADAERLCDAIAATGALEEARTHALELVADAKAALPTLDSFRRRALELVADAVAERYA